MSKEMVDMTNREILLALMGRMDGVESSLGNLHGKIDALETGQKTLHGKIDALEAGQKTLHGKINALEAGQKTLHGKIDALEAGQKTLHGKINALEAGQKTLHGRIDMLEDNINMEIQAVRTEMETVNKLLKRDIGFLNDKIDRIMILKDVEGVEKMKIRLDVLEQGYQILKVKMG